MNPVTIFLFESPAYFSTIAALVLPEPRLNHSACYHEAQTPLPGVMLPRCCSFPLVFRTFHPHSFSILASPPPLQPPLVPGLGGTLRRSESCASIVSVEVGTCLPSLTAMTDDISRATTLDHKDPKLIGFWFTMLVFL